MMDIKKILIVAAILLIAIIGYNYYSSAQSKESRAEKQAEIESLRAKNTQAEAQSSVTPQASVVSESPNPAIVSQPNQSDVEYKAIPQASLAVSNDDDLFGATPAKTIKPKNDLDDSICDSIIKVAESIMRNRQNGIPIAKSLEVVSSVRDGTEANEAASALTKNIVIQAYETPSFSTESYKDDAVREFGAKQYLACMRAFN